jgi:hypothetical protein
VSINPIYPIQYYNVICQEESKEALESDYPGPQAPALHPIHDFATTTQKRFSSKANCL